jgi:hypothetical protein
VFKVNTVLRIHCQQAITLSQIQATTGNAYLVPFPDCEVAIVDCKRDFNVGAKREEICLRREAAIVEALVGLEFSRSAERSRSEDMGKKNQKKDNRRSIGTWPW